MSLQVNPKISRQSESCHSQRKIVPRVQAFSAFPAKFVLIIMKSIVEIQTEVRNPNNENHEINFYFLFFIRIRKFRRRILWVKNTNLSMRPRTQSRLCLCTHKTLLYVTFSEEKRLVTKGFSSFTKKFLVKKFLKIN